MGEAQQTQRKRGAKRLTAGERSRGNGAKQRRKAVGRGKPNPNISQAVLSEAVCDCGCGTAFLADTQHGQRYIDGHGGKRLWKRRRDALIEAVSHLFIADGCDVQKALWGARVCVEEYFEQTKRLMARFFGYDYDNRAWKWYNTGTIHPHSNDAAVLETPPRPLLISTAVGGL